MISSSPSTVPRPKFPGIVVRRKCYAWNVPYGSPSSNHDGSSLRSLSPALAQRIPMDIVELTMHFLDQTTLSRCARVCRAWTALSLYHLYGRVELRSRSALYALSRMARTGHGARVRLSSTRELRLRTASADLNLGSRFCHAVPTALGKLLPQLETITFDECLRPLMHHTFFRHLGAFAGVRTLVLSGFKLANLSELQRITHSFPRLIDFSISRGEVRNVGTLSRMPHSAALPIARGPGSLQRLELGEGLSPVLLSALVDWFVELSCCQSVTHLEVHRDSDDDLPSINHLLGAIGSSLTNLVEHGSLFEGRQHVNLEHNTQLRFLESSVSRRIWDADGVSWLKIMNELHGLLATIAGDALDALTLHFVAKTAAPWMHSLVDEADTDPRPLYNVLRAPAFRGLRRVELLVEVECSDRHSDAANADSADDLFRHFVSSMRALLAPWDARRILALTPVYWEHPQEERHDPGSPAGVLSARHRTRYDPVYLSLGLLESQDAYLERMLDPCHHAFYRPCYDRL